MTPAKRFDFPKNQQPSEEVAPLLYKGCPPIGKGITGGINMSKVDLIRLDMNLGFIEKIVLTDGTVLENCKVLYRAPVPTAEQCETLLNASVEISQKIFGIATAEWSAYPEMMAQTGMFKEGKQ